MYALVIYCLKAGACLAVFYLCFKLLLSRETFHRFNRIAVLGAMVLSFVLPLCVITVYRDLPASAAVSTMAGAPNAAGTVAPEESFSRWEPVVVLLFLAGMLATLAATLWSLAGVWRIVRRGRRERLDDGTILVYAEQPVIPFSWGRYIVLSDRDLSESGGVILAHERAHLRLHHSWDLLLTDLAGCLQWFNPAMWLLRRELRAIHEYEADEAVLAGGADARDYQLLLIRKAAGGRWYSVANSFNHSKLKNRIAMMLRQRSSRWAGAKALVVLPLTALALGAFAQTSYRVTPPIDSIVVTSRSTSDQVYVVGYSQKGPTDSDSVRVTIRQGGLEDKQILWIIDGREATPAEKEMLNPNEIGSIKVLKDVSVKQKYPGRDVEGVIEVQTKKFEARSVAEGAASEFHLVMVDKPLENRSLIYIDGRRASWDEMSRIAPDRIESVTVLKGASAVEMYGPDAAEGAVVVKTQVKQASDKEPVEVSSAVYHKVRQGDTVRSVARRYGLSVNRLCGMNHLDPSQPLQLGRALRVK